MSLALLAVIGLAASAPAADPAPRFDALRFFDGATQGTGRFKAMMRAGQAVRVDGRGRVENGTLVLDQTVTRDGTEPKPRQWRIREVSPGRYAGTLTDAEGPIAGETVGNRLHLHYTSTGGYAVQQWLTLAADGRSAQNRLVAKRFGITVATVDELIRKVD